MTQRRRLDAFLAAAAAEAGADLRDGAKVDELEPDGSGVTARVGDAVIRADTCVGADGANGVVARTTGVERRDRARRRARGERPARRRSAVPELERTAVIELGIVPGGYGWVFPKGDHANLGVGGWGAKGRGSAHISTSSRGEHDVDPAALTEVRGHRLPMRRLGHPAQHGRVLLVGDAAGLVDPLSGDGMYEAFTSAALAADAVLTDATPSSTRRARRSARSPCHRLVGGEARARPASAARVLRARARRGCSASSPRLLCGELAHPASAAGACARGGRCG